MLTAAQVVDQIAKRKRNLPNLLTLARIFFVPLVVATLLQEDISLTVHGLMIGHNTLALVIFLAAGATDLLDGYLARRWGEVTTIGTLLDPIADKLLISSALIALVQVHAVPAWMVILIIGREFAISGLRSIAASAGYTIEASDLGKTKMVSQVATVAVVMLSLHKPELVPVGHAMMWLVVVFSIASAVQYFRKFWRKIDDRVKTRRRKELLRMERRRKKEEILTAVQKSRAFSPRSGNPSQ